MRDSIPVPRSGRLGGRSRLPIVKTTPNAELPLIRSFPELTQRERREPLCCLPTPVSRAQKLEGVAGCGPVWIKSDAHSAEPYGGSKPRKLEWVLGRVRARGILRVVTSGGLGTNHGLATALYARELGIACDLLLVPQPLDDRVRLRILQLAASGAQLHSCRSAFGAVTRGALCMLRRPRATLIPTGGSSPVGTLGFVNAGLELAEQVAAGVLPEPARLYVALGSGGTAAGLATGLALAGLRTLVVAVCASDLFAPGPRRLTHQARQTLRLITRGSPARGIPKAIRLEVDRRFIGAGYGSPTSEGERARRLASELLGEQLEPTYTAKALAALLDRESGSRDPVVFWNTHAASEPELALPDWQTLPASLQRFFRDSGEIGAPSSETTPVEPRR